MTTTKACHNTEQLLLIHTTKQWAYGFLATLIIFFFTLPETGLANTIKLSEENIGDIALDNVLVFYDPGLQEPDIDTISQLNEQQWRNAEQLSPALIFSPRKTLWFRLKIENQSTGSQKLALSNSSPISDSMSVYVCTLQKPKQCEKKLQNESDQLTNFINIPSKKLYEIHIEIRGFHSAFSSISLQSTDSFNQHKYKIKMFYGIIDGIVIGLTLYILLLAIKTRQPMYFSYCMLGIFNLLTIFLHQNFFGLHIKFIKHEWLTNFSMIMPLFVSASLSQFIRTFIETKNNHKIIDKFLYFYIALTTLIAIAFLLGTSMAIILPPFIVSSGIASALMFYLCAMNKNHLTSSMLMLATGISMPVLSGVITLLAALGAIKAATGYMHTMQVFDAVQMMLFSLAMLSSVKYLENEHRRQTESAIEASIISEAHNRLLAHLNHELRTPLNGILGAAEILVHKSHPRDRHIFSMICHTALPLKHLIDEMVNIRSVTENKKYLQNTRFDLQSLLQECMDVFLPIASEKNIRLFFRVDHDIANDVTGDPNRLRQILLNLIGNACKFTTNGEVGLYVRKECTLSEKKFLYYFEVTDSGMGINKADEQRLFGIFEPGNITVNPKGTGLGLSIVRELSELLGGSCGYENNETIGSKFWFSAILEPHQKISRKTHKAFENLNFLIADESQLICTQIIQQISGTAKRISTANSIDSINSFVESGKIDVAVIHQKIIDDNLLKTLSDKKIFTVIYSDQSESINQKNENLINYNESIIRKTSTEAFSLQIADAIVKKSNILYRNISDKSTDNRIKILAAEDIPANQHIIRELIESLNFTAIICENGKQAFDLYVQHLLEESPFTAIIMDCEMPIQDGFETSIKIRSYETENNIAPTPIIALTAHTEAAYRRRSEQAGMDAYLTKPVTAERILQCLLDAEKT